MDFRPYSKAEQLKGHQKEKDKPKFKPQRHKKKPKTKKRMVNHGVQIPSRAKRGEFTLMQKMQIIDLYGNMCLACQSTFIEFHHRKFRSGMGRNNPRNGSPLCQIHHRWAHTDSIFAQSLRDEAKAMWGPYYFWDKYDLWKHGLIERPTDELMERFFEKERDRLEYEKDNPAQAAHLGQ